MERNDNKICSTIILPVECTGSCHLLSPANAFLCRHSADPQHLLIVAIKWLLDSVKQVHSVIGTFFKSSSLYLIRLL